MPIASKEMRNAAATFAREQIAISHPKHFLFFYLFHIQFDSFKQSCWRGGINDFGLALMILGLNNSEKKYGF